MIETRVRVLSSHAGVSLVVATESNGCGACASRSGCGLSGLGRYFGTRREPIPLPGATAAPGQELVVGVEEGDLLAAGLWAYLLPALLAVVGAALAAPAGLGDAGAALFAGLGLGLGLGLARILARTPRIHARRADHTLAPGEAP